MISWFACKILEVCGLSALLDLPLCLLSGNYGALLTCLKAQPLPQPNPSSDFQGPSSISHYKNCVFSSLSNFSQNTHQWRKKNLGSLLPPQCYSLSPLCVFHMLFPQSLWLPYLIHLSLQDSGQGSLTCWWDQHFSCWMPFTVLCLQHLQNPPS